MIIAAETKALFRCDGVFFFFLGVGRDISYLKDQGTVMEQPKPSLRRMAAGSLWKNRLALPPFLLFSPHRTLTPTVLSVSSFFFYFLFVSPTAVCHDF